MVIEKERKEEEGLIAAKEVIGVEKEDRTLYTRLNNIHISISEK